MNSNLKYIMAKNRVERTKRYYNHLFIYIIVNLVITGFKVSDNLDSWDSFINEIFTINVLSVWCVWGIVLLIHTLAYFFGQNWEDRKIAALMEKELSK